MRRLPNPPKGVRPFFPQRGQTLSASGKGSDPLRGLLLVDKPAGMTSHDVVQTVRRKLGVRRIGHTGTLDPMAEGLLILLVGRQMGLSLFLRPGDPFALAPGGGG